MQLLEDVGCGVEGHGPDCLCDVIIDKPVEIPVDLSGYWGVERFRRGMPALDVLERLVKAHDLLVESTPGEPVGTDEQRLELAAALAQGEPIERALTRLHLEVGDFALLVTPYRTSNVWKWTLVDLIELQGFITSSTANIPQIVGMFAVEKPIAGRLFETFGVKASVEKDYRRKLTDAQRAQVIEWALEEGVSDSTTIKRCLTTFGVAISRPYVVLLRKQNKK